MTISTANILVHALKLGRDVNGNPLYHFPKHIWPPMDDKTRLRAGLKKYRGKRFGEGYVMQSYNLEGDIDYALYAIQYAV